jgi:hypothetical protein
LDFTLVLPQLGELFKLWAHTIFISPFVNISMLWILVPIWLGWFFAEFFQEKEGTSIGNAMSNATIIIWASVDCTRQTLSLISSGDITGLFNTYARFALIAILFIYGLLIILLGLKGSGLTKKIGRIREVTYVFAMFIPVLYNFAPLSISHIIATIIFFPLFYFALEIIDRLLPDPKAIIEERNSSIPALENEAAMFPEDKNFAKATPKNQPKQMPMPLQGSQNRNPMQMPNPMQNRFYSQPIQNRPIMPNQRIMPGQKPAAMPSKVNNQKPRHNIEDLARQYARMGGPRP